MPDEFDFKKYKSFEEFSESLEGYRYYHDLYLKAINHPIRRKILKTILTIKNAKITKEDLFLALKNEGILTDRNIFTYNVEYLKKAFCIEETREENSKETYLQITQNGRVIEFLNKLEE
ncbi:MAG: hypothetical protein BAJALOKI1v1_1480003 [Promethearchaeota archaeon]|nr:MAG: hypothetical protein BAJALOKI1v1_1480003 [Candidatus Lokiarchaeota archaeon]